MLHAPSPQQTGQVTRLDQIEETLGAARQREQAALRALQSGERSRVESAIGFASFVIGAAIVLGLMATFMVVRSVIRPLQITTDAIRQVNSGSIEIDLPPIRPDEFGDMAVALRQFRDQAERLRHGSFLDLSVDQAVEPGQDPVPVLRVNEAPEPLADKVSLSKPPPLDGRRRKLDLATASNPQDRIVSALDNPPVADFAGPELRIGEPEMGDVLQGAVERGDRAVEYDAT